MRDVAVHPGSFEEIEEAIICHHASVMSICLAKRNLSNS